jgi:hypothetical protein
MNQQMTLEEAEEFFAIVYFGAHHIPSQIKKYGEGWAINDTDVATYDFNTLTRMLFLAHDMCYRLQIQPGGTRIKIAIWKRYGRDGDMCSRHPTIEMALGEWRKERERKI